MPAQLFGLVCVVGGGRGEVFSGTGSRAGAVSVEKAAVLDTVEDAGLLSGAKETRRMAYMGRMGGNKGWAGLLAGSALAMAWLLGANDASAQGVSFEASTQGQPAPAATADQGGNDHDKWVGHLGIGWYGVSEIPVGALSNTASAPAIGVRYWLDKNLGIDAALGFATASSSSTAFAKGQSDVVTDGPSTTAFLLHGGLPLSLYSEKHYTLLVIPELNFGIGSGTVKSTTPGGPDTKLAGMRFDLGARAGAEIHFGFMGIPALALEGSVGLFFTTQSAKTDTDGNGTKQAATTIGTTSFNSPWDFFRSSVAARYYF